DMGERKVLNKYYQVNFDPTKITRQKQIENQQIKVRMMLPMSIRYNTRGNWDQVQDEDFSDDYEDLTLLDELKIEVFEVKTCN
ncbi:unnamed protein product, partial [Ilex paraguariensis]